MASYPSNSVQFGAYVPNSNSISRTLDTAAVKNLIVNGCTRISSLAEFQIIAPCWRFNKLFLKNNFAKVLEDNFFEIFLPNNKSNFEAFPHSCVAFDSLYP